VALVVCTLAATAAASYVLTYDPLRHGSGVLAFGRDRPGSLPLADATVSNALGTEFQVRQPPVGTRLGVAFGLTNDGPFDVEVVAIGSPFPGYLFTSPGPIASAARGGSGEPYPALEPFVLEAGSSRDVGVLARAGGCPDGPTEASPASMVVSQVPVTWRFAGTTRTSHVDLAFRGSVTGYPQCASP
jgi:hypothetical protein